MSSQGTSKSWPQDEIDIMDVEIDSQRFVPKKGAACQQRARPGTRGIEF